MGSLERLVFFGTPRFSVPTLDALAAAGRRPLLVVSQPARQAGRGRKLRRPPVAQWAHERGVDLVQPERVKSPGFLAELEALAPDLAVVVAFGQIFPAALLAIPGAGCVNLHASLLPRYRGASPVAAAIAAGERVTGVTTMQMEEGLDSGPILLQREVEIGPTETTGELEERLSRIGATLVVETIEGLERGTIEPRPQRHEQATFAPRLKKEEALADFSLAARRLADQLRAFTPWPGLLARFRDSPLKLISGRPLVPSTAGAAEAPLGSYLGLWEDCLAVRCGEDTVFGIEQVQRAGRRVVSAREFTSGERLRIGESFG